MASVQRQQTYYCLEITRSYQAETMMEDTLMLFWEDFFKEAFRHDKHNQKGVDY